MTRAKEPQTLDELVVAFGGEEDESFSEPWQARAFALTLALSERGVFSLKDFQAALIARIREFETTGCVAGGNDYYTCWLEALECLVTRHKLIESERISSREDVVVFDAASRKAHQRTASRDSEGRLKVAPLFIDDGSETRVFPANQRQELKSMLTDLGMAPKT